MYSVRYQFYPMLDKQAEMLAHVEEKVRQYQSEGVRSTLLNAIISEVGNVIVAVNQFDHLSGFEEWTERNQNDAQRAWLAKQQSMSRQPTKLTLYENLIPTPASVGKYIRRIVRVPAPGKAAELRQKVLEQTRQLQLAEVPTGCSVQVTGSSQGAMSSTTRFDSLTWIEDQRASNATNADLQKTLQELNALQLGPQTMELFSVVVPMNRQN